MNKLQLIASVFFTAISVTGFAQQTQTVPVITTPNAQTKDNATLSKASNNISDITEYNITVEDKGVTEKQLNNGLQKDMSVKEIHTGQAQPEMNRPPKTAEAKK